MNTIRVIQVSWIAFTCLAACSHPGVEKKQPEDTSIAIARLEAKLDAQLATRKAQGSPRIRTAFIGSKPRDKRFEQYLKNWVSTIEEIGTRNYPEAARGKIYGSLLMSVNIRPDGSVAKVVIHRSSGHVVLDDAAKRIIQLAAPFEPFPENIRRDYDEIEITRTWTFTHADTASGDSPQTSHTE